MATDGTMADYCDILRSHKSSDTLNLEVLRFGTGELLEGQLNGRDLAVTAVLDNGSSAGSDNGNANDYANDNSAQTGGSPSGVLNLNASASGES